MAHGDLRQQGVDVLGGSTLHGRLGPGRNSKKVTEFKGARCLQGGAPMVLKSTSARTLLATKSITSAFPGRAIQWVYLRCKELRRLYGAPRVGRRTVAVSFGNGANCDKLEGRAGVSGKLGAISGIRSWHPLRTS
eukprot:5952517-Pyramimonas_sp.AAC.1